MEIHDNDQYRPGYFVGRGRGSRVVWPRGPPLSMDDH